MLEHELLLLFGACAAFVLISGLIIVKFYRNGETVVPVIVIPVTPDMENLEFIVRSCVYTAAEKCSETLVLAVDFGADAETIRVFEKLMRRSCLYEIINSEECSESICKIVQRMV